MRTSKTSTPSFLLQAMTFGVELLRASARRHARHAGHLGGHLWRRCRPAHLPLYVLAAVAGAVVVLLVMTAWLRVITYIPTRDAPRYPPRDR